MNKDLLNVMGNFVETELDYIENCEKEKLELEQENTELKKKNESLKNRIKIIKRRRVKQTQKIKKYKTLIPDIENSLVLKKQQIKELKDNWNKLREYLNEAKHEYRLRDNKDLQTYYEVCIQQINNILDKMQEIEEGDKE